MCGLIAGVQLDQAFLRLVRLRGLEGVRHARCGSLRFAHSLLPLHGHAPQPFTRRGCGMLVGEVYNWKQLSEEYQVRGGNDAEIVFKILDGQSWERLEDPAWLGSFLSRLEGQQVIVYAREEKLLAVRSWPGTIMLAYHPRLGMLGTLLPSGWRELHPRHVLYGQIQDGRLRFREEYVSWAFPLPRASYEETLRRAVERMFAHTPHAAIAVGGMDSLLIARLAREAGYTPVLIHTTLSGRADPDEPYQEELAQRLGLRLVHARIPEEEVVRAARILTRLVEPHTIKVSSALPLFFAAREARKHGFHVLYTGSGADELLAAYARSRRVADRAWLGESLALLLTYWERNGWREDAAISFWQVEARHPYLERDVIMSAWKTFYQNPQSAREKHVHARLLAMPMRKHAAQYSSGMLRALQREAKRHGYARPSDLLATFTRHRRRAIVLMSGGKDSFMAHIAAVKHGYHVVGWLTLHAPEGAWLYHTPLTRLVRGLAASLGMRLEETVVPTADPLVEENILADTLKRLKEAWNADVLVTGGLASGFQRDRMLRAAETAGMSLYTPYWQVTPEDYLKLILREGVQAMIIRTAAEGLPEGMLGRVLDEKLIRELEGLGVHATGEGGEYETFVIDSPYHSRRLVIDKARIIMDGQMRTLQPEAYRWIDKREAS